MVAEEGMAQFNDGEWDAAEACWRLALSPKHARSALGGTRSNISRGRHCHLDRNDSNGNKISL